jgi:hypothetical protein
MNRLQQTISNNDSRSSPRFCRGAILAACFLFPACSKPADPVIIVVEKPAAPVFDPGKALPPRDTRRPPRSSQPEPFAVNAREMSIHRNTAAIDAECRRAADGDWARWERDTAVYRTALKARIDALKVFDPPRGVLLDAGSEPLEGLDNFPLFEVGPRAYLQYLYQPEILEPFRKNRAVVVAHHWLRDRGIDLIFVPVPKMTEVYIEHFLDPCPPDGIIAPQVRRTLHELLQEGVEVVDGLPLFRSLRDSDAEYLYNTADPHWGYRGIRVMAKEVADRITRYKFGASARYGLPIVRTAPDRLSIMDRTDAELSKTIAGWLALSEQQRARAREAQSSSFSHVTLWDGQDPPDDPESPVLIIGNSFVQHFREQLIREMNLLVCARWRAGGTTEAFGDFLREPELLKHCKVVVWVTSDRHFPDFKPLPEKIISAVQANNRPR